MEEGAFGLRFEEEIRKQHIKHIEAEIREMIRGRGSCSVGWKVKVSGRKLGNR